MTGGSPYLTAFADEVAEDPLQRGTVRFDLELGGDVDPNVRLGRGVSCDPASVRAG